MYDKDNLKNKLTINQISQLLAELGGEPTIEKNVVLGKRIAEKLHTKFYANSLYTFNNTYYEKDSDKSTTKKEILKINENIKNSLITATLNYLKIKHAVTYNELDLDSSKTRSLIEPISPVNVPPPLLETVRILFK